MKHIAQKITREAAKDPVNPVNPVQFALLIIER